MYQWHIPFSREELLITEAPGLQVPKRPSTCLSVSAQPSTERLHCLKVYKQNVNWGIKACVFDLPRTCGSPITWVLLLKTQVGAKPAVSLVPKAPSRMPELPPPSFFLATLKALPVCIYLSLASEAPGLISVVISLFCDTGLCSSFKCFYENFYASFLELLPPPLCIVTSCLF